MKNPFDGTFFKFLIGFTFLLLVSFVAIYLVTRFLR